MEANGNEQNKQNELKCHAPKKLFTSSITAKLKNLTLFFENYYKTTL